MNNLNPQNYEMLKDFLSSDNWNECKCIRRCICQYDCGCGKKCDSPCECMNITCPYPDTSHLECNGVKSNHFNEELFKYNKVFTINEYVNLLCNILIPKEIIDDFVNCISHEYSTKYKSTQPHIPEDILYKYLESGNRINIDDIINELDVSLSDDYVLYNSMGVTRFFITSRLFKKSLELVSKNPIVLMIYNFIEDCFDIYGNYISQWEDIWLLEFDVNIN